MNKATLTALKGSIRKWEKIAAGTGEDYAQENCPLCTKFLHFNCTGCPVSEEVGQPNCNDTPYRDTWLPLRHEFGPTAINPEMKKAARLELHFLKSLLPKPAKKRSARS